MKKNKGITLVALVITIVVMLILAGITLGLVLGENGLITKARLAKTRTIEEEEKEKVQLIAGEILLRKTLETNFVVDDAILQEIVDNYFGTEKAIGTVEGERYKIQVNDTGNIYYINEDGTIESEKISINKIIYSLNGGSFAQGTEVKYSYNEGEIVSFATPQKSGFGFAGWYTNSSFTGNSITSTSTDSVGDITVYAKWTQESNCDYFTYAIVDAEAEVKTLAITGKTNSWTTAYNNDTNDAINLVIPAVYHGESYPEYEGFAITQINDSVFSGCTKIQNLTLSNKLEVLGKTAFDGCTGFNTLVIPKQITSVGNRCFRNCTGVKKMVLEPDNFTINYIPFENMSNLEELTLAISLVNDSYDMLNGAGSKLKKVTFTVGTGYGSNNGGAWNRSEVDNFELNFEKGILTLGNNKFSGCTALKHLNLPNTVTSIGTGTFQNCTNLENFAFPNSVTEVNENSFKGCSAITELTIPSTLKKANGRWSFADLTNCKKLTIESDEFTPGWWCFKNMTNLEEVKAPISWGTSDYPNRLFEGVGTGVKKAIFTQGSGVGFNWSGGYGPWDKSTVEEGIEIVFQGNITSIGNNTFNGCTALKHISIPSTVTVIGAGAFNGCSNLQELELPNKLEEVNENSFNGCSSVKELVIPAGLKKANGRWSFSNMTSCKKLTIESDEFTPHWWTFTYMENLEEFTQPISWGSNDYYNRLFENGCTNLKKVTFTEGSGVGYNYGDYQTPWYRSTVEEGVEIIFQGNITSIGNSTFRSCNNVKNITLPSTLKTFGENVFRDNTGIESISLPDGFESMGGSVFRGCSNLKTIRLPATLKNIGSFSFNGVALTDVYYAGTTTQWNQVQIASYNSELTSATIHTEDNP